MENYGNGQSTGLDQTAAGKILTGFTPDDLSMRSEDRDILARWPRKSLPLPLLPGWQKYVACGPG